MILPIRIIIFVVLVFLGNLDTYAKMVVTDVQNGMVTLYNYTADFDCKTGSDKMETCYPKNWITTEGKDGRIVAYPGFPWTYTEGSDGRRVVYPGFPWTYTEGSDGRRVVYPGFPWTYTEGSDGRRVVYPGFPWTYTEGSDGRRVVYPGFPWTYTSGSDGRRVVYPGFPWTYDDGYNGRKIAHPSDWEKKDWIKGVRVKQYTDGSNVSEFLFQNIATIALIDNLSTILSEKDLADFVMYSYLQEMDDHVLYSIDNLITTTYSNYNTTTTCGKNSSSNDGKCSCLAGYIWEYPDNSKNYDCILKPVTLTADEMCKISFGLNSLSVGNNNCNCKTGYQWTKDKKSCEIIPLQTIKTKINRKLVCKKGELIRNNKCVNMKTLKL